MQYGFRFDEKGQVLFKKKYVTLFWLLESLEWNASLQGLREYEKSRKRVLYVRILCANSMPVILHWHESYTRIAWISVNVCKTSADTQKAVVEKNDHDGYECKHERSFVNSTVLSVRFLLLPKVQSFDGRCALFFFLTLSRFGILLVGKSRSVVLSNVFLFLISSRQKKITLYNFWT